MSNGKQKGGQFERDICRKLSLWVSQGKKTDLYWRSAMSGGRATVGRNKGESIRQAGDITCVASEGHKLTDRFYIECKHYKNLDIIAFFLRNKGKLAQFWKETKREADRHDRKPMLIAKQNNIPILLIVETGYFFGRSVNIIGDAFIYNFDDVIKSNKRHWEINKPHALVRE